MSAGVWYTIPELIQYSSKTFTHISINPEGASNGFIKTFQHEGPSGYSTSCSCSLSSTINIERCNSKLTDSDFVLLATIYCGIVGIFLYEY